MKFKKDKVLFWLPRILAILYVLFLAVFALDVFSTKSTLVEQLTGFLIHLTPNLVLLVALHIAWKFELVGGLLFLALAILMSVFFKNPLLINLVLFGPLLIIGILFLTNAYKKTKTIGQ